MRLNLQDGGFGNFPTREELDSKGLKTAISASYLSVTGTASLAAAGCRSDIRGCRSDIKVKQRRAANHPRLPETFARPESDWAWRWCQTRLQIPAVRFS